MASSEVYINVGGAWQGGGFSGSGGDGNTITPSINVAGTWKAVEIWINVSGTWKKMFVSDS